MDAELEHICSRFHYDEECMFWCAQLDVPCWGPDLPVWIEADDEKLPTEQQLKMVATILAYRDSIRPEFEKRVFDWYCEEVYGSFVVYDDAGNDITESYAPRLKESGEIWGLIDELSCLMIPELDGEDQCVRFTLGMECRWDPEHGLGVALRDWQIVEIGGEGDVSVAAQQ